MEQPTAPKPTIIIAQVEGSGTPPVTGVSAERNVPDAEVKVTLPGRMKLRLEVLP